MFQESYLVIVVRSEILVSEEGAIHLLIGIASSKEADSLKE